MTYGILKMTRFTKTKVSTRKDAFAEMRTWLLIVIQEAILDTILQMHTWVAVMQETADAGESTAILTVITNTKSSIEVAAETNMIGLVHAITQKDEGQMVA